MVVVVVVFVVVVVLVPLHNLGQPPLVQHQTGQVPHVFLLQQRPSQCPVALVFLGSLLVPAVGCRRLAGQWGRWRWGWDRPPAPQDPAAGLGRRGAAVCLGGAEGVSS